MSVLQHPAPGTYSLAGYGPRAPIDTPQGKSTAFHRGRDFSLGGKTFPVLAARAGVVRWAYFTPNGGNEVLIEHKVPGFAYFATRYGHLAAIDPLIRKGVHVPAGQRLGMAGATGRASGTHLHFEVFTNPALGMTQVDPDPYLPSIGDDVALTPQQERALQFIDDRRETFDLALSKVDQLWQRRGSIDAAAALRDVPAADPAAIADAIVEQVGDELAQDVLEAIARRLAGSSG